MLVLIKVNIPVWLYQTNFLPECFMVEVGKRLSTAVCLLFWSWSYSLSTPGWFHLEQPVGPERASDTSCHPEPVWAGESQAAGSGLHPFTSGLRPGMPDHHAKRWGLWAHVYLCSLHDTSWEMLHHFYVSDGWDLLLLLWRDQAFLWVLHGEWILPVGYGLCWPPLQYTTHFLLQLSSVSPLVRSPETNKPN